MTLQYDRDSVSKLISRLDSDLDYYNSSAFDEDNARLVFIDKLFEALGWDVTSNRATTGRSREVIIEQSVQSAGLQRRLRPDYTFFIDGQRQFVAEAKSLRQSLTDSDHIYQLKSYAWSLGVPFAILTNFANFRVFDCRFKPNRDTPRAGLVQELDFSYRSYLDKWPLLVQTFGRDSVAAGSLITSTLLVTAPDLSRQIPFSEFTGFIPVDESFLNDLESWRRRLAISVLRLNPTISEATLRHAVQRLLDKIMFIRVVEDRSIRVADRLQSIVFAWAMSGGSLNDRLRSFFAHANNDFHGGIFAPHYSDNLDIEENILQDIIESFYFPSPYRFDAIKLELLGSIYERFIARHLVISRSGAVEVRNTPDTQHMSGVYYTPEYIVDTIVDKTIGSKIIGRKPEEIKRLSFLDPACGSGSFLIGAFNRIVEEFANYYEAHPGEIRNRYGVPDYDRGKLSPVARAEIVLSCLFGFDKDPQAVEITMLSLYLKILEDAHDPSRNWNPLLTALPDLSRNIICCNTLIAPDFAAFCIESGINPDPTLVPYDPVKFGADFADVIVGNPPYVRLRNIIAYSPSQAAYIRARYETMEHHNPDLCLAFLERGLSLLKRDGVFGYIVSSRFMIQDYGKNSRRLLSLGERVHEIVNFQHHRVFRGLSTYTCLLFLRGRRQSRFRYSEVLNLNRVNSQLSLSRRMLPFAEYPSSELSEAPWRIESSETQAIKSQMLQGTRRLWLPNRAGFAEAFFVGPQTSLDDFFLVKLLRNGIQLEISSALELGPIKVEPELLRPAISGRHTRLFGEPVSDQLIITPYDMQGQLLSLEALREFPQLHAYFLRHEDKLRSREANENQRPYDDDQWYRWGYPKNTVRQFKKKLTVPGVVRRLRVGFDQRGSFVLDNVDVCGIALPEGSSDDEYFYLMGLLNSAPLQFFWRSVATPYQNSYFRANKQVAKLLPIANPSHHPERARQVTLHSRAIYTLRLQEEAEGISQSMQIDDLIERIDDIVFEIYGLSNGDQREYIKSSLLDS